MELGQKEPLITTSVACDVMIEQDSRLADLLFGSASGFAGKIVEYPFDTLKVHLQTQSRQSVRECVQNIIGKEGVYGFFNGISAPLVGSMAENAVLFLSYNQIQSTIRKFHGLKDGTQLSLRDLCLAGGLSGAVVSFVLTPIELLKCRLQTQSYLSSKSLASASAPRFTGPTSVFFDTLKSKGITGLYRGHTGTLLREVAGGMAWFGVYELTVKRMIANSVGAKSKQDLSTWQLMGAGALAGMSYNAALYPADVVKSRMQSGLHGNDSFFKVSRDIWNQFGSKFFFRGFGITVCRSAPSSGVIFLTYEWMSRNFGVPSK